MSVRLGYVCICNTLRSDGIYMTRTLTINSISKKTISAAIELALKNIDDLISIIEWNEAHGIRFFRMHMMFPHMENPKILQYIEKYDIDFARDKLAAAGKLAREYGHRLTFHPGPYVQLGTPRENVVDQSIKELNLHAQILLAMGMTPALGSCMIIHGGGKFDCRLETLARWRANFRRLPASTQQFIVLENDEMYSVMDLLPMVEELNIPLCIDFFHHTLYGDFDLFDPALLQRIFATWKRRGIKPKCHYSQQQPNARRGTHSDAITEIDNKVLRVCAQYDCDIMIESGKNKESIVLDMYFKYFTYTEKNGRVYWILKT